MLDEDALAALLATARRHYAGNESFDLGRREILAVVRGIVAARPRVRPAELVRLAGRCGIALASLVRIGRSERAAEAVGQKPKPTQWSGRLRLTEASNS